MEHAPTHSGLLAIWERGDDERMGGRALALLAGAAPDAAAADLAQLSVGARDALLLDLREQLFGHHFHGVTSCPCCDEEIELTFDAAEVRRTAGQVETATIRVDGIDVDFRVPNGGDLAAIEALNDVATARALLLARCIDQARRDGETVPPDALPPPIIEAIAAQMAALDPQADVSLDVACPECAHEWCEPFDVVAFFWSELASWARRLLGDVHALASAYGWGEREILGLTPARRRTYLELLG